MGLPGARDSPLIAVLLGNHVFFRKEIFAQLLVEVRAVASQPFQRHGGVFKLLAHIVQQNRLQRRVLAVVGPLTIPIFAMDDSCAWRDAFIGAVLQETAAKSTAGTLTGPCPVSRHVQKRQHRDAARVERGIVNGEDVADRKRSVEMREQRAAARGFPDKGGAQRFGLDLQHHQIGLAVKMQAGCLAGLRTGREMDVAVAVIDGGAGECTGSIGCHPSIAFEDFVDRGHAGAV